MTAPPIPETANRGVSRDPRHRVVRRSAQTAGTAHHDVIETLRAELQAVFERLDAYLASQATPRLTAVASTPATVDQPDPFEGLPALISVGKAAAILGLSRATAYRLADADELPVQRMGGRVYVVTARLRATYGGAA